MPSVQYLREFINERLTAAAEQIFLEFEKTIVQYEQEIDRQRRLMAITWKPEIKLHRTDVPQQHVCKEEEVVADQQLWNQETSSNLDQGEPKPPKIKEEQEQLCSSQEGEQLVLKEEIDAFMVTAAEEKDHSEPEPKRDHLNCVSSAVAVREYQGAGKKEGHNNVEYQPTPDSQCKSDKTKKSLKCDVCGEVYKYNYEMDIHYRIHTEGKPFSCKTCGKKFVHRCSVVKHMRIHTGEKLYHCKICGKKFVHSSLVKHMSVHTGEKPYHCKTCGKRFSRNSNLTEHMKIHTGEKPYHCKTCGKAFRRGTHLFRHIKIHI
ncbi:zinc finger protein 37-like [Pelmatolapia mariae]|uniref:zinc finger protein 37-like n=1 Tax=Pelmatolapia mariae TaxID=158779 RepID=UPI002FE5E5EA